MSIRNELLAAIDDEIDSILRKRSMSICDELLTHHEEAVLDAFNAWLDADGDVGIAGLTYAPSYALREVDPVAYKDLFNAWLDAQ